NSTPPPVVVTSVPQQLCTLNVYSQCSACYGYVWINGMSTGEYIDTNGAKTFTGLPCGTIISVEIRDEYGYISDPRIITLVPGQNILTFTSW
ncbi:MAG: hypothetical protein WCP87_05290, partial [Atribacterota bacterium]